MKSVITIILVLVVAFGLGLLIKPALGKTADNGSRAARDSKLKDLLSTLKGGVPEESPRTFQTPEGYLRFLGAPPSTYFSVDPNKRATPQEAADAFLVQGKPSGKSVMGSLFHIF